MADDDEIDVLGDFSFNSCFAQNNQGIPSCSNREDTVHPQWLLDSTVTNWYDSPIKDHNRIKEGPSRKLSGDSSIDTRIVDMNTTWNKEERALLVKEMKKYGRDVRKISQTIKTKTEAEIQALIEAEYGVNLDTPSFGLDRQAHDDILVVQEEIVTEEAEVNEGLKTKKQLKKKTLNKSKNSLLRPDALTDKKSDVLIINPSEIFYEDDLTVGSTESIGSDMDSTDIVSKSLAKLQQGKVKPVKKMGNHRRKVSRNYDKRTRNKSADALKSPQSRSRKDSAKSEDSVKSPKMQIILGSGQALPLSEGEQVIKIEKKKDSEPESDIEIDVDSDDGANNDKKERKVPRAVEEPVTVPLRKFEPMPKRQKKINLNGGGGYTIMHTENGDLYEIGAEPRKERPPKKQPIHLIPCRFYNAEKPAPYSVRLHVSALVAMDAHAHVSRGEVCGLLGGVLSGTLLALAAYRACAAAASRTHCDMEPVSAAAAAEALTEGSRRVVGWHHSHPAHAAAPSVLDLRTLRALQRALRPACVAFITSQRWPTGIACSQYKCIRVEDSNDSEEEIPTGYQFSVKLVPDITLDNLDNFLQELRVILRDDNSKDELSVDMVNDVCPFAKLTYLEKLISSVSHHMRSAGYEDDAPVTKQLIQGIRDVFR